MFDWLYSWLYKDLLEPPSQIIRSGQKINGILFPANVEGFIRFNYNETFGNIKWNAEKSFWTNDEILWNGGKIETFEGIKHRTMKSKLGKKKIHKCWEKIGYLPCYWRRTRIILPEDQPVGKNPSDDLWPKFNYKNSENTYVVTFSGKIAIHEICRPIIDSRSFIHEILVNPLPCSNIARYYEDNDATVPYLCKEGVWSIAW